jgi:ADP-ribose pyrophosphatase
VNNNHLVETKISGEQVYKGNFLHILRDTVRLPDGKQATREYVLHPGAVVVIALLDDGRVVLERQHRYPVGRVMVEFPAGKLDAGENPQYCGQRELLEETGYSATQWAYAGPMHLAIAYSDEVIHIYFAKGLTLGERKLDDGDRCEDADLHPVASKRAFWCMDIAMGAGNRYRFGLISGNESFRFAMRPTAYI